MPYAHMFEQDDSNSAAAINAALKVTAAGRDQSGWRPCSLRAMVA